MTCFHPISAYQLDSGEVVFVERGAVRRPLSLPCGQCIGCRLERSRQWATRCMHEAQLYDMSSFVTLTYSDDCCPVDMSLHYRDFQLFMKRLRKRFGAVRFYMCGEYGEKYFRPHFHACLFGCHFADRVPWSTGNGGFQLYRSKVLDDLWPSGFASVGDVTFESAAYVARYVMKKVTGDLADAHYERVCSVTGEILSVVPEFTRMSLKPGIGMNWIRLYHPEVIANGAVIVRGHKSAIPRYYKNYLRYTDGYEALDFELFKASCRPEVLEHTTPERLAVREIVMKAAVSVFGRSLE